MLILAVGLFAIAALVGAAMAVMHSLGKTPPPVALAVLHGVFAVSGLVALLLGVWPQFSGRAVWALGIFVLAALGGFTLALGFHWRGKPLPSSLVAGHGALALIAFLILFTAHCELNRARPPCHWASRSGAFPRRFMDALAGS
jgi:hypothetical protein